MPPPFPPAYAWRPPPHGDRTASISTCASWIPRWCPPRDNDYDWCGDGVEIYIDHDGTFTGPNYDNPGTRQIIIHSPRSNQGVRRRAEIFHYDAQDAVKDGPWTSPDFGAWPLPDGYAVEAFVRAADLGLTRWTLAAGARIGLDLGHNVSYDDPGRAGCLRMDQYFMCIVTPPRGNVTDYPYYNPRAFCSPRLLAP